MTIKDGQRRWIGQRPERVGVLVRDRPASDFTGELWHPVDVLVGETTADVAIRALGQAGRRGRKLAPGSRHHIYVRQGKPPCVVFYFAVLVEDSGSTKEGTEVHA